MHAEPAASLRFQEGFYASDDGLALYYRTCKPALTASGACPTILCLHGVSRNHRDFMPLVNSGALCANWILVDLRGRGHSQYDSNPDNYNPTVYVADILRLLDFLQLPTVDVIGTSLGGILAMLLNHQYPERIGRVVLNDIGAFVARDAVGNISTYLRNARHHDSWADAVAAIKPIYGEFFTHLTDTDWLALAQRLFRQHGNGEVVPDYDPALFANATAYELDLWPFFNSLQGKPTLVLRGANSVLLPPATLQQMLDMRPDLLSATIPHRGHAPFLDEPNSLAALKSFFYA